MTATRPRVFTIAPDRNLLDVLADSMLSGFPDPEAPPSTGLELARATILLPTRRAARLLEEVFFSKSGGRGLLLPRIRPIGDIDEDLLASTGEGGEDLAVPPAISRAGQLLLLIDLIDDWARDNPHVRLAAELAAAPHQALNLAQTLAEFLDGLETEEIDPERIPALYGIESARHREAILDVLAIARQTYPARLGKTGLLGRQKRRSLILRREATRLAAARPSAPFIAAGSTGTVAATRALLAAVAALPRGAVILPGLDRAMDEASWQAVGPTHPQFALKQLIAFLGIDRAEVGELQPKAPSPRQWLLSEVMRPTATAHQWRSALAGQRSMVAEAMTGLELVETRSLREQASAIALMLRESLETPGRSACLVTPDRRLARRVKGELRRWNLLIDDSAGEPLIRHGAAGLLNLLLEAVLRDFAAEPLAALMRHDLFTLGHPAGTARHLVSLIEISVLRAGLGTPAIGDLPKALRLVAAGCDRGHLLVRAVPSDEWDGATQFAARMAEILEPLQHLPEGSFGSLLDAIIAAGENIAGERFWSGAEASTLGDALAALREHHGLLRHCDLRRAAAILRTWLNAIALRPPAAAASALSILGLLEARLVRPDLVIVGGLNEGTWPAAPDPGPWLNRPMREILGMSMPETDIGQTAHDFVQALGGKEVRLVWSRRSEDAPLVPSRWVLRLQMILKASGLTDLDGRKSNWSALAQRLAEPDHVIPCRKPQARPPVAQRPRQISVTRVETLIRDPYAIYAREILKLEPLEALSSTPDVTHRGIIFHAAIGSYLAAHPAGPAPGLDELLRLGAEEFRSIAAYPELAGFWWPRFCRIAEWLVDQEPGFRAGVSETAAERRGLLTMEVAGEPFALVSRADRIDVFAAGGARISDYKTGRPPNAKQVQVGLAPQLTLQAAMLARGAMEDLGPQPVRELRYVLITGGDPPGRIQEINLDIAAKAEEHLAGLKTLLLSYANANQPYLPRVAVEREDEEAVFDHLSRYREWSLSGEAP